MQISSQVHDQTVDLTFLVSGTALHTLRMFSEQPHIEQDRSPWAMTDCDARASIVVTAAIANFFMGIPYLACGSSRTS
jgi:hypothetical protein